MWIQVRESDNVVTRLGETKRSFRPDTVDYEVDSIPSIQAHQTLMYDGTDFTINTDTDAMKAELEPRLIEAYRKWQDAEVLDLVCKEHCKAMYEAVKAEYDAIG